MAKNKSLLSGVLIGMSVIIGLALVFPVSDSAIPPTPAWSNIQGVTDAIYDDTITATNINATIYNDRFTIITDGSIEVEFIEYP